MSCETVQVDDDFHRFFIFIFQQSILTEYHIKSAIQIHIVFSLVYDSQ